LGTDLKDLLPPARQPKHTLQHTGKTIFSKSLY
jgi:hypothetical protein